MHSFTFWNGKPLKKGNGGFFERKQNPVWRTVEDAGPYEKRNFFA